MSTDSRYFVMTIAMDHKAGEPPAKIINYLAKLLKKSFTEINDILSINAIRIPKVLLNDDMGKVITVLREHNLKVSLFPIQDETTDTSFGKDLRRILEPEDWKTGDVIEGIYEVFGSAKGGMGKVYFIFHRLWKMNLAIKTPLRKAVQKETKLARFLREAELWVDLGLHPNIATCYYARIISGLPRLFIEYIDGGSLGDWLEKGLIKDVRSAVDLMLQFCHGMIHAEDRGMIHRDIKPENCLITKDKILKITDFGLVKRLDEVTGLDFSDDLSGFDSGKPLDSDVTFFEKGVLGSPRYMAPERFVSKSQVDIRADIYSFGIMLYEVFTRGLPFNLRNGYSLKELISAHLRILPQSPRSLNDKIPESLAALMLTCIEKKAENRYSSFHDVCDALEKVVNDISPDKAPRPKPDIVELKADSLNNQAVSMLDLGRLTEAKLLLENAHSSQTEHLEAVYNLYTQKWISGEISDREVVSRMEALKIETRETPEYNHLMGLIALQRGDSNQAALFFKKSITPDSPFNKRWEQFQGDPGNFIKSLRMEPTGEITSFAGHLKSVIALASNPEGQRCFSLGEDGLIRIWDTESGRCLKHFRVSNFSPLTGAFSPDGSVCVVGYGNAFKTVDVWSVDHSSQLRKFLNIPAKLVAICPQGKKVAACDFSGRMQVLHIETEKTIQPVSLSEGCSSVIIAGKYMFIGLETGKIVIVDTNTANVVAKYAVHDSAIKCMAVSPDGKFIVSGGADEAIIITEIRTGKKSAKLTGHGQEVTDLTLFRNGKYIISVSADGTIKTWETSSGRCYRTMISKDDDFHCCSALDQSGRLLTGSHKGGVRLWSIEPKWFETNYLEPAICKPKTFRELVGIHFTFQIAVDEFNTLWRKGKQSSALQSFEKVRNVPGFSWAKPAVLIRNILGNNISTEKPPKVSFIRAFHGHTGEVTHVEASQDCLSLLTAGLDGVAAIWDITSGRRINEFRINSPIRKAHFLPAKDKVLTWSDDSIVRIWDASGKLVKSTPGFCFPASLSSTKHQFGALSIDMKPVILDLQTEEAKSIGKKLMPADYIHMDQDLRRIYSILDLRRIQIWDLHQTKMLGTMRDLNVAITAIKPDVAQTRVMAGASNGELFYYVIGSGVNVLTLRGHKGAIRALDQHSTSNLWLSASDDCTVRLWHLQQEKQFAVLEGHTAPVKSVCFFPNLFLAATGSSDGSARLWGFEWDVRLPNSTEYQSLDR